MIPRFLFILVFSLSLVLVFGCKSGGSGPGAKVKRYPYERLHIQHEVSGVLRGKEDVYSADFGRLEARYSDLEILGERGIVRNRTIIINKGADLYTFNIESVEASHTVIPILDSLYKGLLSVSTPKELSDYTFQLGGLMPKGIDTVLGFRCDKWVTPDEKVTLLVSNGMLLRKLTPDQQGGVVNDIAVAIDTNWVVDSTVFTFPANVTFKEKKFGEQ